MRQRGITSNIAGDRTRTCTGFKPNQALNLVERFWNKVKHYRRVATRYEKTARNFLAIIHVASIMVQLQ